jgi:error-prone DNA polymerase
MCCSAEKPAQQHERWKERPYPKYAELHCLSNFTFLRGASHPEELGRAGFGRLVMRRSR